MSQHTLIVWSGIIILYIACKVIITALTRRPWKLELMTFLSVMTSAFGVVSGGNIVYQAVTSQYLMTLLGYGTITLIIGASVAIWLSIEQILKS